MTAAPWTTKDVWRLHAAGFHPFPVGRDKKPAGRWRKGGVDYVEVQPTEQEIALWLERMPLPTGWIILCGGPKRVVCLDVEAAGLADTGVKGDVIRGVLARLPDTCKRPTPSGGMHAWIEITEGDVPTGRNGKLVQRLDDPESRKPVLLAELRGHGQYALILGFGRGDLPDDWHPVQMTRAEWDEIAEELHDVSDLLPVKVRRRRQDDGTDPRPRAPKAAPKPRDWTVRPPRDTADVIAAAVTHGLLSWLDVLEDGWQEIGATLDGWSMWLRPDYGSAPTSESSANGAELRGHASLTMHSSAVPWADAETSYSPAEVLTRSNRLGGYPTFAEAMVAVEHAARELVVNGVVPRPGHPLHGWPVEVLEGVVEVQDKSGAYAEDPDGEKSEWDATDLLAHEFPDQVWAVERLLPPGLTLFSGAPKQGKSFFTLLLDVVVAGGAETFLGWAVTQGRVLYLSLEDGARRAQRRLRMMPGHEDLEPGALTIRTVAPRIDQGLLTELDRWYDLDPESARVVCIDVFQRVRAMQQGRNAYAEDYASLADLQRWANKRQVCVVVLHHNRKAATDDVFELVSGSTGMTGAVDTVWVMRGPRESSTAGVPRVAALYVGGRDAEDVELSLEMVNGVWRLGAMPYSLAAGSTKHAGARKTWWLLFIGGAAGATTEQVAEWRGASADATRHHLGDMAEKGWVEKLNPPAPDRPVRWRACRDDGKSW